MSQIHIPKEKEKKEKAFKTMVLLTMGSIVMIFAALTSAYVVSASRPDWLHGFELPQAFTWSTVVILLSSITFHLAKTSIKKNDRSGTTMFLWLTLALGIGFIITQFMGFNQIIESGYFFTGSESNVTTSFLYVIVLVHIAHLLGGLISLLIIIYNHFKQKYNSSQTLGIELGAMYWHFLDGLWIYLFLFFTFYN